MPEEVTRIVTSLHVVLTGYKDALKPEEVEQWANLFVEVSNSYLGLFNRITLVVNKAFEVEDAMRDLENNVEVIYLDRSPLGALATACIGLENVGQETPVLVAPADTLAHPTFLDKITRLELNQRSVCVAGFEGPSAGRNWSYIHLDDDGEVLLITESVNPTNVATSGHFVFGSRHLLLEAAQWCFVNQATTAGLYYCSSALNYAISEGLPVSVLQLANTDFTKVYSPKERK